MSYRRPKKENNIQKVTYTKKNITKHIDKEEDKDDEYDNYNNEDLNDIIKAFEYFDMNNTGKINILELKKILSSFGEIMSDEEIYNLFRSAGIEQNSNEDIDYINFINFWIGNN